MYRLLFKEFFDTEYLITYEYEIQQITFMKDNVSKKKSEACLKYLENFVGKKNFYDDLNQFIMTKSKRNENFKY